MTLCIFICYFCFCYWFGDHLLSYFFWSSVIKISLPLYAGTVIREEVGLTLDKADKSVLGHAAKVVLTKDSTTIVGDGSSQDAVSKRVAQIKNLIEVCIFHLILTLL